MDQKLSLEELHTLWDYYDKDRSDSLNREELAQLLERLRKRDNLTEALQPGFITAVFNHLDKNDDGVVEWREFVLQFNDFWVNRENWFQNFMKEQNHLNLPTKGLADDDPEEEKRGNHRSVYMVAPNFHGNSDIVKPTATSVGLQQKSAEAKSKPRLPFISQSIYNEDLVCPHCRKVISSSLISSYLKQRNTDSSPNFSSSADYSFSKPPNSWGIIPKSFINSPYNLHRL